MINYEHGKIVIYSCRFFIKKLFTENNIQFTFHTHLKKALFSS